MAALRGGLALPQLGRADCTYIVSYIMKAEVTFNGGILNSQSSVVVPVIPHVRISGRRWFTTCKHFTSALEQELTARAHCKTLLLDHR
jgi:hypothetical protein